MTDELTLTNRSRVIVPVVSLVTVALMFYPVLALVAVDPQARPAEYGFGVSLMLLFSLWLGVSAWRAPYSITFSKSLTVRRLLRKHSLATSKIKSWKIAYPDDVTLKNAPPDNGLLMLKLADGTRFRCEVNKDEIQKLSKLLPSITT